MYCYADGVFCPHLFFIIVLEVLDISSKELQINEEIRDKELRVIGSDGAQLGIMSANDALNLAAEKNLDLVKIAPQSKPPVCKIMDYGKYRFEQAKREKEARKKQHVIDIKEVRLSLNIDVHDFNTKLNNALKFIGKGDKVKVSIRFRGREMGHPEIGYDTMKRFADACSEVATVEKPAKLEGRNMLMFLAPKSLKQ
ncbi:MAG: translation initiation factor IF-3 [Oscillospiraceae bacterium]|nr:translation initiation factor IF-3 [Oscillospiraceae bacterium]